MAISTEVILLTKVHGLGAEGDRISVNAGYARNYLLPQRLAAMPQDASAKRLEQLGKVRAEREADDRKMAEDMAKKLRNVVLTVPMPSAQPGKIFGGVTTTQIAELLVPQGFTIDRKQIKLERPIHSPGEFSVNVHPHPDVTVAIKVIVTATEVDREKGERGERGDRAERPARMGKKERKADVEKTAEPVEAVAAAEKPAKKAMGNKKSGEKKSS